MIILLAFQICIHTHLIVVDNLRQVRINCNRLSLNFLREEYFIHLLILSLLFPKLLHYSPHLLALR